jgi:UDP-2,3-diacylglucosamine pyrophosphatase LpxH
MMKRMAIVLSVFLLTCGCASPTAGVVWTSTPSFHEASTPDRVIVVISDLHLGLGRNAEGAWYRVEDFRWHKALKTFLDEISKTGNQRVDLVVAGDFLEMWQLPANVGCEGASPDLGCTVDEMKAVATWIAKAHEDVFDDLRKFSQTGENRLHIIPGNHDSSLLVAAVWEPIGEALGVESGRVNFARTGVWKSADGSIVIEHGHQIGIEANRYSTWPDIVRTDGGKEYIIRPWGEQFVQKMFNEQENNYPIIDNLSPESAGIRYRMADRGLWGTGTDIAQFVSFNLFQTSLPQQASILGAGGDPMMISEDEPKWDITRAREHGHRLFVAALPTTNDLRAGLLGDSEQAKKARLELDALVSDEKRFPDENVKFLCEQAAIQSDSICETGVLGASIVKLLVPREWVFTTHLRRKEEEFPKMRFFVYGHTHLLEEAWQTSRVKSVQILNSGAFHRVIDEEGFLRRVKAGGMTPDEGLKRLTVEDLPSCYTYVFIPYNKDPQVLRWVMKETDDTGHSVKPGDEVCK